MNNSIDNQVVTILRELTKETTEVKTEIKHLSKLMTENHDKIQSLDSDLKKTEERLEIKVEELEIKLKDVEKTLDGRISNYEKFQFRVLVTSSAFVIVLGIVASIFKFGTQILTFIGVS